MRGIRDAQRRHLILNFNIARSLAKPLAARCSNALLATLLCPFKTRQRLMNLVRPVTFIRNGSDELSDDVALLWSKQANTRPPKRLLEAGEVTDDVVRDDICFSRRFERSNHKRRKIVPMSLRSKHVHRRLVVPKPLDLEALPEPTFEVFRRPFVALRIRGQVPGLHQRLRRRRRIAKHSFDVFHESHKVANVRVERRAASPPHIEATLF